ncbi:IclR family transcriptional regulator [Labrys wisconsinensis]|uniref:IclR family acetate operon transcriptional repressor n=1 Tax=Labrys wisconsinensis TaxID=425677 RepID=A0ABU0JCL4_9HYPH|nr:IclR family transcriptional regulator C-terminal domain-containing protein [Labrys wisconsinensis]MDQ0472024.1 IclR family acetate operon transcriptional repressor [Labrys wisconsinensis]
MRTQEAGAVAREGRSEAPSETAGGVQSLIRALSILDTLAESEDGLSLTALARAVGLPPSSAHRLLTTLQRKRFVRFEPGAMTWRVGVQAFVVGNAFARSREVVPFAMPFMRQLMDKTGETVNLYVPNDGQAICIAQVQSRQVIRAISRPGGTVPLQRSAAGKAMLARMGRGEVEDILSAHGRRDPEEASAVDPSKLRAEIEAVRARGFALDDEEVAPGLRCIAVPILDEHGAAQAAMSIAGPITRLTDQRLARLAGMVVAAGEAVTREFGGGGRGMR